MDEVIILKKGINKRIGVIFFNDEIASREYLSSLKEETNFIYCTIEEYHKLINEEILIKKNI